jgi:hypothetical protein
MKRIKNSWMWYVAAALLGVLLTGQPPLGALAAPAQQGANLLQNPDFERPFADGVAQGWQRWFQQTAKQDEECLSGYHYQPKWAEESASSRFINSGFVAQYVGNNWDTWHAGVQQTVSVTPGETYRFTFFGQARAANEPLPAPSESNLNANMRAGIDPNGSGNWADADVVWGPAGSPHDQWQQFTVEATATGDKVTVFAAANWGVRGVNQCRQSLEVWFDSAQLVSVGPPPTNTPPPPPPATATAVPPTAPPASPTPEFTPAPTAVPTDTPPPAPAGGTICVNAFADENGNGLHEANEGYMAGVTFTVATADAIVGQAISTGTADPICFSDLPPGQYQVAQQIPGRLELTTAANATIAVTEGQTVGLEFGSRLRPLSVAGGEAPAPDPAEGVDAPPTSAVAAPEPAPAPRAGIAAVVGLVVIGLAAVLLAGLLFMLLRRGQAAGDE